MKADDGSLISYPENVICAMKIFDVTPIGKPRMTRRDKWEPSDAAVRYFSYKSDLLKEAIETGFKIANIIDLVFLMPMPDSWSQKKKREMNGKPHLQKPDTDNMIKAFCDALTDDDSGIWDKHARKFWWDSGKILVIRNDINISEDFDLSNVLYENQQEVS